MTWIGWVVSIGSIAILAGCIVVDEIRLDCDLRRYERTRDARLRQLLGDLHNPLRHKEK